MKFNELKYLLELTDKEKAKADELCSKRVYKDFGPLFKEQRTIIKLQDTQSEDVIPPQEIIDYLDLSGYVITDYRLGKCVKKGSDNETSEEFNKRIRREFKIGSLIKNIILKKMFDQRLGQSTLKNNSRLLIISHHPYDIAGMSTDKSWKSCMNIRKGSRQDTPWRLIEYGGMVCYLMNESDWTGNNDDINKALARIAIKRLVNEYNATAFMFLSEKEIYGLNELAREVNMDDILEAKLNESNKITMQDEEEFKTADDESYTDTNIKDYRKYRTRKDFKTFKDYVSYCTAVYRFKVSKIYEQEEMIDVEGDVTLDNKHLTQIPIKFNKVTGDFSCSFNPLDSLEGCPEYVGGEFLCSITKITSLKGGPEYVGGHYICASNKLTSLVGAPTSLNRLFDCSNNQLTSLKGGPIEVNEEYYCYNNKLTSLEGAPELAPSTFACHLNELTSLEFAPKSVGRSFLCYKNKLTSLKGSPKIVNITFNCLNNSKLKSLKGCPELIKGEWQIDNRLKSLPEYQNYLSKGYTNK